MFPIFLHGAITLKIKQTIREQLMFSDVRVQDMDKDTAKNIVDEKDN